MKLKDVIVITLLGVAGLVISMVLGMVVEIFGIYGLFLNTSLGSVLSAPIYFAMCHKIHKRGTVFLYYLIMGLVYTLIGFFPMLFILLAAGLVGEVIIFKAENYTNDTTIAVSYIISQAVYSLHGFFFILILGVQGLVKTFPNLFTLEAVQRIHDIFLNFRNIMIILLIQIVASFIGTLFGKQVNKRFFNKNKTSYANHGGILK